MESIAQRLTVSPTVVLAVGLIGILVMMILPVPPIVLDLGLMLSFAFAILIFTVVLFVERPLDFSSFPAILLVSLLLRLALNISSTKLIIGEGHTGPDAAGGVIEGFAMFIMGGNLGLGLIVFGVLIIVNFLVITKGAGRMAEVGARFALDAMPGKQMAIDADVAAGAISHVEAGQRREREQRETAFLGSLDGASKFVKGDAVAGLLITGLNLLAGIAIGLIVHGIPIGEAIENYSILTVGDGLVTQIPAVIVSVAAALLLSKGRAEGAVDLALVKDLGSRPEALGTVAAALLLFGLFPGLPFLPFVGGALMFGYAAWRARSREPDETTQEVAEEENADDSHTESFGDLLEIDDIHVELSPDLVRSVISGEGGFDARVEKIRRYVIQEFGFIMPPIRVTDRPGLAAGQYEIRVHGVRVAMNALRADHFLALIGEDQFPQITGQNVREPVYGAAARWVDRAGRQQLVLEGATVVEPSEVLSTHLLETVQAQFPRLMTRRALKSIIDAFGSPSDPARAEANKRFLDDIVPEKVSYDLLQQVLRDLLSERVSIRNLPLILEAIAECRSGEQRIEGIVEHVRRRIAFQFVSRLKGDDGKIGVVKLGTRWENVFSTDEAGQGASVSISGDYPGIPDLMAGLRQVLDRATAGGAIPAIAVTAPRRRAVRGLLSAHGLANPVLSFDELSGNALPNVVAEA